MAAFRPLETWWFDAVYWNYCNEIIIETITIETIIVLKHCNFTF